MPGTTDKKHYRMKAETGKLSLSGGRAELTVRRGQASWTYFYVFLGFALSIEATVISFVEPLKWYWKLAAFFVVCILTVRLVLFSGRFQNLLIRWKNNYEEKSR